MVSSINSNVAALYAQSNINSASNRASSSIARLSSGNRIVRASDDVASLSAGTSLRANVTTLKAALVNASQGSSLLQVADGALSQVSDILQRQKALAVQAGGGSLSASERSFLNQEFTALTSEIDRLVGQTNFSGVKLLDGSLTDKVAAASVDSAADSGVASITFLANVTAAQTISVNGVTLTAVAIGGALTNAATVLQYNIGSDVASTIDNLVAALNAADTASGVITTASKQALSAATYSREGNTLVITSKQGGTQSGNFSINAAGSTFLTAAANGIVSGGSASTTFNMFAANTIAAANIDASVTAAAATATEQFQTADTIIVGGNGGALTTVYTLQTGDSLRDITAAINANTSTTGISAEIIGVSGAYNIRLEQSAVTTTGQYGAGVPTFDTTGSVANIHASAALTAAGAGTATSVYSLAGGTDNGVAAGKTVGVGTIGDSLVTAQNQQKSSIDIVYSDIADADLIAEFTGHTFSIGAATDLVTFSFSPAISDQANAANGEIAVGATLEETLDNAVTAFNNYVGNATQNFALNQLEALRDGNTIRIQTKDFGDARDIVAGTTLAFASANLPTGAASTGTAFDNGTDDGVTTNGVTNGAFVGTISGFNAVFSSQDTVDATITIGEHLYTASEISTKPASDTVVRFSSDTGGGYFDVEIAGSGFGQSVNSQADAAAFADRLDNAFSTLTFYQDRLIENYNGNSAIVNSANVITGSLVGTSLSLSSSDFSEVSIDSISVEAPVGIGTNGVISFVINGEEYTSAANVGTSLSAGSSVKFNNASDSSKYITFTVGQTAIDFSSKDNAAALEAALKGALGVGDGSAALRFQVGSSTADTLKVSIGNVTTDVLFDGADLDVLTSENAAIAADVIDGAIDIITSARATVGSAQSRFNFVSASVESSIQNQDAARGALLDTDVSTESTAFATAQVQLQAGIAVLAQANQMPQQLLKLIG